MTTCFICGKNVGNNDCGKHTEEEWLFWYRKGYSPLRNKKSREEFKKFVKRKFKMEEKQIEKRFVKIEKKVDRIDNNLNKIEEDVKDIKINLPKKILGKTIKCQRCGYMWKTKSEMDFTSCPKCATKTRNESEKEKKERLIEWEKEEKRKEFIKNFKCPLCKEKSTGTNPEGMCNKCWSKAVKNTEFR